MKFLILSLVLISFNVVASQELPLYYGNEFLTGYQNYSLKNEELKNKLFLILSGGHVKNDHAADSIFPSCSSAITADNSSLKCVEHIDLGYGKARQKLFGQLHLKKTDSGAYSVTDVYCNRTFTDADFGGSLTFGPDLLPSSGNLINTEHTWPQSRFTGRFSREMQKSDLHHLFPTDSEINSRRGSLRFGNVVKDVEILKCPIGRLGHQAASRGEIIYEAPKAQRGNTARAIFYFATRYQMKISPAEEAALRQWNIEDPIDAEEFSRNQQIELLQGNRNPFIDFADLIDRINSFQ